MFKEVELKKMDSSPFREMIKVGFYALGCAVVFAIVACCALVLLVIQLTH